MDIAGLGARIMLVQCDAFESSELEMGDIKILMIFIAA